MPTNSDRVRAYLVDHPEGQDDDQIGAALHIDRVQINAICHRLAAAGAIRRDQTVAGAKIRNWPITAPAGVELAGPSQSKQPAAEASKSQIALAKPTIWLLDSHAAQQFAFVEDAHLTEDAVKAAIKQALEAHDWHAEVHWGHDRGIDIEAVRGNERFVLEAKGEGISNPARSVKFDGALGELIRRMNASEVRYGLALPAHRQFIGLVARLPLWIRLRLNLWFFFVRRAEQGLEVGVFPPDGKHTSL